MRNLNISKSNTIFQNENTSKPSIFRKTQILKALQNPNDLDLLHFQDIKDKEGHNIIFNKDAILEEFLLNQTIRNCSFANVFILVYSFLFFLNCAASTLHPYFTKEFSFSNISSYFFLGVYVLLANFIVYLLFNRYSFRAKKNLWWKIQNLKLFLMCLIMTIAQIRYLIDMKDDDLFKVYKFLYYWGYLQFPLLLFMIISMIQGLLAKFLTILFTQLIFITYLINMENVLDSFEIAFLVILFLSYICFFFMYVYFDEINMKEKYELYLNFKKSTIDWQNIINNVPYGIALFKKNPKLDLVFSNKYGNDVLNIDISSPNSNFNYFDTLSQNLGEIQKISISKPGLKKNTIKISSERKFKNSLSSFKELENSIPEKGYLKDILQSIEKFSEEFEALYRTIEIKPNSDNNPLELSGEKKFLIKLKYIVFENAPTYLLIFEDNTTRDIIDSLRENNIYKSKLLSSFSHELRTPLNGALPLLKNLYNDENFKEYDAEKHYQLCIAINSLLILQNVLNDIVDYAQINSNQLQLNCTKTNIKKNISECLEIVSLQVKEKSIDLEITIDEKIPKNFCTDRNRFIQILLNVLRNAIKFSNNGGRIWFSASTCENSPNHLIIFKIKDTGIGINDFELKSLQTMLSNIKNYSTSDSPLASQTLSLGLLISQNLALILGPSNDSKGIKIDSKVNEGTIVEFSIEDKSGLQLAGEECSSFSMVKSKTLLIQQKPLLKIKKNRHSKYNSKKQSILWLEKRNEIQESNEAIDDPNPVRSNMMNYFSKNFKFIKNSKTIKTTESFCCEPILVVDDDPFNLLSAQVILKKLGYGLIKSFNGAEAIEIVKKKYNKPKCGPNCKRFLLILMDYNMPVMNGIESTKILKEKMKNREIPEIPIIACSAFGAKDDLQNCFEAGMNDYISKPINVEALKLIFKKWIVEK